jgi:hypothetical protein
MLTTIDSKRTVCPASAFPFVTGNQTIMQPSPQQRCPLAAAAHPHISPEKTPHVQQCMQCSSHHQTSHLLFTQHKVAYFNFSTAPSSQMVCSHSTYMRSHAESRYKSSICQAGCCPPPYLKPLHVPTTHVQMHATPPPHTHTHCCRCNCRNARCCCGTRLHCIPAQALAAFHIHDFWLNCTTGGYNLI